MTDEIDLDIVEIGSVLAHDHVGVIAGGGVVQYPIHTVGGGVEVEGGEAAVNIFGVFTDHADLYALGVAVPLRNADDLIQTGFQRIQRACGIQGIVISHGGGGVDVAVILLLSAVLKGHGGDKMCHTVVLGGIVIGVNRDLTLGGDNGHISSGRIGFQ